MSKVIKWAIIGAGKISRAFANDLKYVKNAELLSVGSKSMEKAKLFADEFNLKNYYDDYEKMLSNPDIDAVYIGTTHNFHYENMLSCLKYKKAVLCEKPFTVNSLEAEDIINKFQSEGIFVMEAMWSRFAPAYTKTREIIKSGAIGEVRFLSADFGFKAPNDPEHRAFNPNLAGGSLLDVGIYPVSLAYWVFGKNPDKIFTRAQIGKTGVDEEAAMQFHYGNGAVANLFSSVTIRTAHEAFITGEKGNIHIHAPFFNSRKVSVSIENETAVYDFSFPGIGYTYEADYVTKYLRGEWVDSKIMTIEETLEIMKTLDIIRKEWNMVYPFEKLIAGSQDKLMQSRG